MAQKLARSGSGPLFQQYVHYPGLDYFVAKFQDELSDSVCAFKAAQLFVPWKVREMMPTCSAVDMLKSFPFLNNAAVLQNLNSELSSYVALLMYVLTSTFFCGGRIT